MVLALGARLALAGGRLRAGLVVAGTAVAVIVLLVAVAVPATVPRDLSVDDRRLTGVVVLVLTLPVVALLASVNRLSAAVRDRRLAALRLLGVTAGRTRAVAAVEALLLGAAGTVVGAAAFAGLVRPASTGPAGPWDAWFGGRPLTPSGLGWLAVLGGVPLLGLVVSAAPTRAVTAAPLALQRQASTRRPSWWRLAPVTAGTALLGWAVSPAAPTVAGGHVPVAFGLVFFAGTALAGVGLPLAVPVGLRALADYLVGPGRGPATVLAARRLQQEPAGANRLVAALLVGLFLVVGARCVLVAWETTPQYVRAAAAAGTGPQEATVLAPAGRGRASAEAVIGAVPGVRGVAPVRVVDVQCTAAAADRLNPGWRTPAGRPAVPTCGDRAVVATCAQLAVLVHGARGCVEGQPAWLLTPADQSAGPVDHRLRLARAVDPGSGRPAPGPPPQLALDLPRARLDLVDDPADPLWTASRSYSLVVPPSTPGIDRLADRAPAQWVVVLDGGAPLDALTRAVQPLGFEVAGEYVGDLEVIAGYRRVLYAVAGVVLGVGLVALLIAGIDRASERRRHLAALAVLGVPGRVVRRSQLVQALAPLALGIPVAAGIGLLAGGAYLTVAEERSATPWPVVALLVVAVAAAGGLVAGGTLLGLGGRIRPADLRRE